MGSYSPLEALRAVLTTIGLSLSMIGFWRAPDGRLAFPRPIRARMVKRRRIQMMTHAGIFLAIGAAAIIATDTATDLTFAAITIALLLLTWHQVAGWLEFERIVGQQPLAPDDAIELSLETRPIIHEMNGLISAIIAELVLAHDSGDADRMQAVIPRALTMLYQLADIQHQIQALIREPSLPVKPVREE